MKAKLLTIGFTTVLISILMCSIVYASWSTLGTGYAVTSNIEGTQLQSITPVTITAGTLDPTVTQVTFKWFGPPEGNGDLEYEETVSIFTNGTIGYWDEGTPAEKPAEIRYAQSTYVPFHGEWRVEVIFHAQGEKNVLSHPVDIILSHPVDITQNHSFFAIPEIPLGTIGATVAMAVSLGLFIIKKQRQQK